VTNNLPSRSTLKRSSVVRPPWQLSWARASLASPSATLRVPPANGVAHRCISERQRGPSGTGGRCGWGRFASTIARSISDSHSFLSDPSSWEASAAILGARASGVLHYL